MSGETLAVGSIGGNGVPEGVGVFGGIRRNALNQTSTLDGVGNRDQQQVWGVSYIDELVQEGVNLNPSADNTCETVYWVCQDANYNVMGLVDNGGVLVERYEYTPYGQRTVFFSPGSNDVGCYAPTLSSRKIVVGGVAQPYGLCEFGHQGLQHDEESGLIYNRARMLQPTLGRFMQRDPLGYVDGMSVYEYEQGNGEITLDWVGLAGTTQPTQSPTSVIPPGPCPAEGQPDCGIRLLMPGGFSWIDTNHHWIQIDFGVKGYLPVGAGFWSGGYISWLPVKPGGPAPTATGGPRLSVRLPVVGYGDPDAGSSGSTPVPYFALLRKATERTLGFGTGAKKACSSATCCDIWDCIANFRPRNPKYTAAWNDCHTVAEEVLGQCCMETPAFDGWRMGPF